MQIQINIGGNADTTDVTLGNLWYISSHVILEIPVNGKFMLIGYDGFAVNFAQNKTCYMGEEGAVFRFGNYMLKITSDYGIQKSTDGGSSWQNL